MRSYNHRASIGAFDMQPTPQRFIALAALLCACGGESAADPFEPVDGVPEVAQLSAVWAFGPADVWVAADAGQMLHYDGTDWTTTQLSESVAMLDIWAASPNDIWAAGDNTVAHYDGSEWALTDLSLIDFDIQGITTIHGFSGTDIWIAGSQSTTAHFDGTTWTRYPAGSSENVALWGWGSDDLYTGGVFEAAHWDGTAWSPVENLEHGVTAAYGASPDDYWVADGERLSHWNGTFWETESLGELGGIKSMWGTAADDIWGVGEFATVYHYDGTAWDLQQSQTMGSPYLQEFVDLHGTADDDIWAVSMRYGDDGTTPEVYRHGG